jgi:hypothetical protein
MAQIDNAMDLPIYVFIRILGNTILFRSQIQLKFIAKQQVGLGVCIMVYKQLFLKFFFE